MLIAFNKPYGVISQFTPDGSLNRTLAEFAFPKNVYPIGRLDADSEGLLLLSDEPELNERLLHPRHANEREYWAQVERVPTAEALHKLQKGIVIQGRKTLPCRAWLLDPQPEVLGENLSSGMNQPTPDPSKEGSRTAGARRQFPSWEGPGVGSGAQGLDKQTIKLPPRDPPIRCRKNVPTCWIGLELIEGKNRQVRHMTAAIGHPTLRLLRARIGRLDLGDLPAGRWKILDAEERKLAEAE